MNPRQMKQMMKQMGIKVDDVEAEVVIIHGPDKEIVIENPDVMKTNMQGQDIYQIMGGNVREEETEAEIEIEEDDVEMVAQQANVSKERAREALEEAEGDIAGAIMKVKSQ